VSSGGEEDFDAGDFRTDDQIRYDAMCEQARQVTEQARQVTELVKTLLERSPYGQAQTVIHKTQGMGAWGAAAVTACFMTMLVFVVFMVVYEKDQGKIDGRLRDLDAWRGVHSNDIGALKADVRQLKESKK